MYISYQNGEDQYGTEFILLIEFIFPVLPIYLSDGLREELKELYIPGRQKLQQQKISNFNVIQTRKVHYSLLPSAIRYPTGTLQHFFCTENLMSVVAVQMEYSYFSRYTAVGIVN
jgi:hypothetical protein